MAKILISAASGKVGRRLPAALDRLGLQYRRMGRPQRDEPGWVSADLDDSASLARALLGCDSLFFAVPFSDAMLDQAVRLLRASQQSGVRHIVRLSAWRAGELPDNRMAQLHHEVDSQVRQSGLDWTILRCNSFWQNLTEMYWPMLQQHGVLALPEGDAPQNFIDAADIARVAADALAHPETFRNRTLDLAGPETLTYSQALARLNREHGTAFRFMPCTREQARAGFLKAGLSDNESDILLSLADSLSRGHMAVAADQA